MTDPCGGDGKRGPLTRAELEQLWRSVTDRSYWEPFVEQGEGRGYEVHGQSFEQHRRVSRAIDRTTQAMYVLPFSGQTDEPSSGGAKSQVTLSLSRSSGFLGELTLVAGTFVEEVQIDFSDLGGVEVHTGRRYELLTNAGLGPGQAGPILVQAQAEQDGRGYDNPAPGTLQAVVQPGSGLMNDGATVVPGIKAHRLVVRPDPDVVVPEHVGQYVELVTGANAGAIRRVAGYVPANPGIDGGTALLAPTTVLRLAIVSGTFLPGETVAQLAAWSATVLYQTPTHLVVDLVSGTVALATLALGSVSGAVAVFDSVDQGPDLVAEVGTASWRVLDFAVDLALVVTNPASPSGGRSAMLDELGDERGVARGAGQGDDDYRERVATLADVVSPNAVRRAINRTLATVGATGWLREVGSAALPGLYYDGDPTSIDPAEAFAYDLDFTVRPQDRYKLALSYTEMRAFFLVGVPLLDLGEFGCAYDAGPSNAYDAAPALAFYDGFALNVAGLYRTLWQSLAEVKAGGVGFDLVLDPYGPL